jgi:hypothetical protein
LKHFVVEGEFLFLPRFDVTSARKPSIAFQVLLEWVLLTQSDGQWQLSTNICCKNNWRKYWKMRQRLLVLIW